MSNQDGQNIYTITINNDHDLYIIDNIDIIQCYFIEDIYSFLKTGKIVFRDSIGLAEFFPLVGGETISITYGEQIDDRTGEKEHKEYSFLIHKINNIEEDGDLKNIIELTFVDIQHYRLHSTHFSTSFKGETYTDIIKEISINQLNIQDFTQFEDGDGVLDYFYTGLKTPADNIKWLSKRTRGSDSKESGYLFYMNTKDPVGANFVTLESLLKQTSLMDPGGGVYKMVDSNQSLINRIIKFNLSQIDNQSLSKLSGHTYLGYDIKRKKIIKREYNYKNSIKKYTVLGKYSLFNDNIINLASFDEINTGESKEDVIDNMYYDDWIKRYCMQQYVTLIVRGHSDRYAGGMIDIQWPSMNEEDRYNKNYMGNYLVKSITHQFSSLTNPQYIQKMICIKNGYFDSDNSGLTKATKTNLGGIGEIMESI